MNIAGCEFPDALWYHAEHQVWAELLADGTVRAGITAMGIRQAGEIYMCRPKLPGTTVEQGRGLAVVELAKAIVSVKSPLAGIVVEVNPLLADEPERVHRDPYGSGWIARVQPADWAADAARLLHGEAVAAAMQQQAWLHRMEQG